MSSKRIFCLYDHKEQPRYIGATVSDCTDRVIADMTRHYDTAKDAIDRGKKPNRREVLVGRLLKMGKLDVRFISEARPDWVKAKQFIIKKLKQQGKILANETDGGSGASGNKMTFDSSEKRKTSKEMMDDIVAYQMHNLYRIQQWTQQRIADKYGLTVKGVQKIVTGNRRPDVYLQWQRENRDSDFDPNEDVPF